MSRRKHKQRRDLVENKIRSGKQNWIAPVVENKIRSGKQNSQGASGK
jgi:hypothetical protein